MKSEGMFLTDISKLLLQKLAHHPTPQSLKNKHFLDELQVLFLTKKPVTHTFVCDWSTSVQVELKTDKAKLLEDYDLNPWNKVETHYYQVAHDHDKYQYTLNCTDKTLMDRYGVAASNQDQNSTHNGMFTQEEASSLEGLDQDYQPLAYEPLFYFPRNVFDYFLKNRQNLTIADLLEKIKITDWVLKVVNISGSVWYSCVIEVHKFKFLNEKFYADETQPTRNSKQNQLFLKNIGSIIYEKRFQSIWQKMRLDHIKRDMENTNESEQEQQVGMCYHLRNAQKSHKLPKMSPFVALDMKGQVIKFDQKRPSSFIPIGDLEGMCSFPQRIPMNDVQNKQQGREVNAFSMKGLQEILNKQIAQKLNKGMRQKIGYRGGKEKVRESDWEVKLRQRMENSLSHLRYNQGLEFQQNELWSDSGFQQENEQENSMQDQNHVTNYSGMNNNEMNQEDSDSQEQEENEYFKKYRQQMKKTFQNQ